MRNHVAIAVEDLESAVKQYVDAFGITDTNTRQLNRIQSEKVKVAILKMENARRALQVHQRVTLDARM